ncbi:probable phospholipase A2 homolog 2 [Lolium rigidum]|uniref:probable phospholipase A2 homolog 2 isoform X1 n=1 Tax=Lolium perenne TaxID=4522 RepID=UPI001F5E2025|nr:probable phospholipase A2 homolog 2 [Lolium rigidum]XP_051230692.1 probable phospholipase A2 homolog 2 isoform X1 [Lolium perenne]
MHVGRLLPLAILLAAGYRSLALGIFGASPPSSAGDSSSSQCSRTCESAYCSGTIEAPLMRYGKYCGVSYTGCPSEPPCDALDACCMLHDACVNATDNDYLNMWCNQSLLDCVAAVRTAAVVVEAGGSEEAVFRTFEGNNCNATDVADEITSIIEAAVYAERILHRVP